AVRPPQPSAIGPQSLPALAHVVGTQPAVPPHTLGVPPPPHVWGAVHAPQLAMRPPQPSAAGPQVAPSAAHVVGTHAPPSGAVVDDPSPHLLGPPPPQNWGATQVPQSAMRPP